MFCCCRVSLKADDWERKNTGKQRSFGVEDSSVKRLAIKISIGVNCRGLEKSALVTLTTTAVEKE